MLDSNIRLSFHIYIPHFFFYLIIKKYSHNSSNSKENMLFYLFITFQIIYSISCDINCHDCPIEENTFDYFVTADRLPDKLNNCGTKPTDDICKIDIIWGRNPDRTQIALSGRDERAIMDTEQTLNTYVQLENKNNSLIWTRSVSYTCATEKCNSFDVLKLVLNSLTLSDNFQDPDIQNLLIEKDDFNGTWCSFENNITTSECAKDIPIEDCMQCSFDGYGAGGSMEFCENCLTYDIGERFVAHEVDFNMNDRTQRDHWMIECQSMKCNTVDNGNLVRQKSTANFNFANFLMMQRVYHQ